MKTPRTDKAVKDAAQKYHGCYPMAHGTIDRGYVAATEMCVLELEHAELREVLRRVLDSGMSEESEFRARAILERTKGEGCK